MLPTRGQRLASSLSRSFKGAARNFAAAVPLTDPIEDTTSPSRSRSADASTVKVTTLQNGIKVASIDTGASIGRVSVLTNVGSRHETPANLGINHLLKNAAFLDNGERTGLRTVREVQEVGGSLDATSSRETSSRNAVFLRNRLMEVMANIAPGITKPLFETWQVADAKNMCDLQNATVNSDDTASNLEALHEAAYRTGLGNSLYSNDLTLGALTSGDLDQFLSESFVGNRMVIAGTDVDHDELLRCAQDFFGGLPSGNKDSSQKQRYFGGDIRRHTSNELTCASLVGEGVGFSSADLASFIVLQRILGVGAYTKWGDNTQSSRLSKAARAVCDGPLSINALNISYSDSGLFGFNAISSPQQIGAVMKAAVGEINGLSKGQLSSEELNRAKTQAKAAILMLGETKEDLLDDLAKQITFTGQYVSPSDGIQNIDKVTVDSVAKAAKSLLSGKSSLSVTGNTASAPYVDDLL